MCSFSECNLKGPLSKINYNFYLSLNWSAKLSWLFVNPALFSSSHNLVWSSVAWQDDNPEVSTLCFSLVLYNKVYWSIVNSLAPSSMGFMGLGFSNSLLVLQRNTFWTWYGTNTTNQESLESSTCILHRPRPNCENVFFAHYLTNKFVFFSKELKLGKVLMLNNVKGKEHFTL